MCVVADMQRSQGSTYDARVGYPVRRWVAVRVLTLLVEVMTTLARVEMVPLGCC